MHAVQDPDIKDERGASSEKWRYAIRMFFFSTLSLKHLRQQRFEDWIVMSAREKISRAVLLCDVDKWDKHIHAV